MRREEFRGNHCWWELDVSPSSLLLYLNGLLQREGVDYERHDAAIKLLAPANATDWLVAVYEVEGRP